MGAAVNTWVCPACNSALIITPFKSEKVPGWKLVCKGTDAVPHSLIIYLSGFRIDAPFLPQPRVSSVAPKSRAASLLARVRGHVGEKGDTNGGRKENTAQE